MADENQLLKKAFSGHGGFGVDEATMVAMVTKWRRQPDQKSRFRRDFSEFFTTIGSIEKCEDDYLLRLKTEFSRFKNIMVLWLMHPWERDARWMHHVMHKSYPFTVIIEIACTRSSEELLGAKRAYQALFDHSVEEDVAYHIKENYSKLLVGLVSSFRYEGSQVDNEMAKCEAKALNSAIKSAGSGKLIQNEEIVRILTTRSKRHLKAIFKHYKELHGKPIEEDLGANLCLQETVKCIDRPAKYFSEAINNAFKEGADKQSKIALTRVIISRADVDMEVIKETYHKQFGIKLEDMITKNTHGHYKDALLSLVGK
ncbi:annexin D4-like protein [Carex littledalei]|uniref:Annexin D4-like protein n=1 Tax=Carex littledalei TaxID=544730 RepID=A0A833QWR4_9POAL|nr:annexin D4-like protein [Carex littledalei]